MLRQSHIISSIRNLVKKGGIKLLPITYNINIERNDKMKRKKLVQFIRERFSQSAYDLTNLPISFYMKSGKVYSTKNGNLRITNNCVIVCEGLVMYETSFTDASELVEQVYEITLEYDEIEEVY